SDDPTRIVYLCNNGNIRVFLDPDAASQNMPLWESFTDDHQGSNDDFTQLVFPLQTIAQGTLGAISSPNGLYMLLIYADHVDLVFNPFNVPRFTAFTQKVDDLQNAVNAQSTFCFLALNNPATQPLAFVDASSKC